MVQEQRAPDQPEIVRPDEAEEYLSGMNITLNSVRDALGAGELAARNLTSFHPVIAPGFHRWTQTVGTLRESLSDTGEWRHLDQLNRPYSLRADKRYSLSFISGNSETGSDSPTAVPNVSKKKGRATEEFILAGQQEVFDLTEPLQLSDNSGAPPAGTWFLIYYRDSEELRAEVSLPTGFEDGRFTGWLIRVLLPTIEYKTTIRKPLDAEDEDVGFIIMGRGDTA